MLPSLPRPIKWELENCSGAKGCATIGQAKVRERTGFRERTGARERTGFREWGVSSVGGSDKLRSAAERLASRTGLIPGAAIWPSSGSGSGSSSSSKSESSPSFSSPSPPAVGDFRLCRRSMLLPRAKMSFLLTGTVDFIWAPRTRFFSPVRPTPCMARDRRRRLHVPGVKTPHDVPARATLASWSCFEL
jgi:hypothetical protein